MTPPGQAATVRTDTGWLRGISAKDHLLFRGIPYAAPPVGELRWRSPQPAAPWQGVRAATASGDRCAQLPGSHSEDCLYLDVVAPASASPARRRPIVVWLHGGGLMTGAGSDNDARRLAVRGDVIVVTVNYRLGILGFYGHPGLENGGAFGIEDQQAALRWVARNAAAFGGDPRNVTLAGESAGSHSVCAQLASPSAAGLFHRAIMRSSACRMGDFAAAGVTLPRRATVDPARGIRGLRPGARRRARCADPATALACLRAKPVPELLAQTLLPLPGYGNAVLPEDPAEGLRGGPVPPGAVLAGTTRDEGTPVRLAVLPRPRPGGGRGSGTPQLRRQGRRRPGEVSAERARLRRSRPSRPSPSDLEWTWVARDNNRMFAEHVPTYAYEFTDRTAPRSSACPTASSPSPSTARTCRTCSTPPLITTLNRQQRRLERHDDRLLDALRRHGHAQRPRPATLAAGFRPGDPTPYVQQLGIGPGGVGPWDQAAAHNLELLGHADRPLLTG